MRVWWFAYAAGWVAAIIAGAALGHRLESKPSCLPGMTQVALDGQVWCMTDEKLHQLEAGYCGAAGRYARQGSMLRLDECVDRP